MTNSPKKLTPHNSLSISIFSCCGFSTLDQLSFPLPRVLGHPFLWVPSFWVSLMSPPPVRPLASCPGSAMASSGPFAPVCGVSKLLGLLVPMFFLGHPLLPCWLFLSLPAWPLILQLLGTPCNDPFGYCCTRQLFGTPCSYIVFCYMLSFLKTLILFQITHR